ncbi:MAG: CpsD/CapB family tyrosine-protein kinase [Steroidobacteraceae bacterium]|nr:CpsD/CapB family tyrosine-protein kinase [Steroidobacteraceae bacterium]
MSIERALEKMRQGMESQAVRDRPVRPTALQRAGQIVGLRSAEKPMRRRPTLAIVPFDPEVAAQSRVLTSGGRDAEDPRAAAAYRILRTRVLHKMHGANWTTLAITSPGAGEGKSLTALNLALSIARARAGDVFLIDLDLRHPSICRYLGVTPPRDLAKYFDGDGVPEDSFFSVGIENLAIAGSLAPTDRASEMLASGRLDELLAAIPGMASEPIVLVDLPPLLVTDEALMVAPRVDAVTLVVGETRTRRDALERAQHLLEDFPFAGVILNHASETYGAESYYGYGYRGAPLHG